MTFWSEAHGVNACEASIVQNTALGMTEWQKERDNGADENQS